MAFLPHSLFSRSMLVLTGCLLLGLGSANAQVSLTTLGTPSNQNFDTLAASGTGNAWTDNSTIAGWYSTRTTYNAGAGASNAGALYSFGTGTATERAVGGVASGGTGTIYYAAQFTNNTGAALTSVDIAYIGEQWRNGGNTTAQKIDFQYQVANAGVITDANTPATGWIDVDTLDFTSPIATITAAALDGNAAANRLALNVSIPLSAAVGQEIWIRWVDINDGGADHALAVDDFSITPQGTLPPPDLSIDDVTLAEGNAGTTNFMFTVSLSAPAPAGGVSFDIATADDSATVADNDYVAQSLLGRTIAAGSSTFAFTVVVNGDTNFETNETFFVNVANVSGATVLDGQGLGTINNDDSGSDLSVAVMVAPDPAMPGDLLTYTVNGSNAGPDAAANAQVDLAFTSNFDGLTPPAGWSCTSPAIGAPGTVSCTIASLPVGGFSFTVTTRVPTGTLPGPLGANASISSATSDPNGANNASVAAVTIISVTVPPVTIPVVHGPLALLLALAVLMLGLPLLRRQD